MTALVMLALGGCDIAYGLGGRSESSAPTEIRFDNTASRSDLEDVPVLVSFDPATFDIGAVGDPELDLRFRDPSTGADLPYEVERWEAGGEALVWVRVPRIAARSRDSKIVLTLDGRETERIDPTTVWEGFDLVLHDGRRNASGSNLAPSLVGIGTVDGAIGDGLALARGRDQRVTFAGGGALFDGWSQFTLEMFIYPDYPTFDLQGLEPRVLDKGGSLNLGRLISLNGTDGPIVLQLDLHFTDDDLYPQVYVAPEAWSYVVLTYDGQRLWLYFDGIYAGLTGASTATSLVGSSQSFELGDTNNAFNGMLDEVRISQTYRKPDWVYAQYLSMTRRFLTFAQ